MQPLITWSLVLFTMGVIAGCASSGGGGSTPGSSTTTTMMTTYYDAPANTMIHEVGPVLLGPDGKPTSAKHGAWKTYFPPQDGNGLQFEKIFAHGIWDENQDWIEHNPDASIRDTWADAVF